MIALLMNVVGPTALNRPTVAIRALVHPNVVVALDGCSNILVRSVNQPHFRPLQAVDCTVSHYSSPNLGRLNGWRRDAAPQPTAPAERCLALSG
jgi:hypothetical protein